MSEGMHILKLVKVEEARIKSDPKYCDNVGDGCSARLVWDFVSETISPDDGLPEENRVMTPAVLGRENNTMKLVKMMLPNFNYDTDELDTDLLVGRRFNAIVVTEIAKSGTRYAKLVKLTPLATPIASPEGAQQSEPHDPFAD